MGHKINEMKNMRHGINYFHFSNSAGYSRIISILIQLPSRWSTPNPNESFVSIQ